MQVYAQRVPNVPGKTPDQVIAEAFDAAAREVSRARTRTRISSASRSTPGTASPKATLPCRLSSTARQIAFVPDDRPGQWMYHCHILEHHAAGMMGHFEVVR
jgi:FtsP/CotA-like multicopper oxidase with cupredoxin domain